MATTQSPNQASDALLDVFEQCRVVVQAFEQYECHERGGEATHEASDRKKIKAALKDTYKEAMSRLADLQANAREHGISGVSLEVVFKKYLPSACYVDGTLMLEL